MLADIGVQLTRAVLIPFIILGTIGNALNLFIFTRPTLLRSSCTLYLIAASIDNIIVIYASLLTRLLINGFSIDISVTSNFLCKLRSCLDRYCSSSPSATRRSWSNHKVEKRCILGAIILACILYSHTAIFFEIIYSASGSSCYSRPGIYSVFFSYFYLVVFCLLPAFCMALLSLFTLINIRRQSLRIRPTLVAGNNGHRRLERQMVRMLFLQVLLQVLCISPFTIVNILALLIPPSALFSFVQNMTVLPFFFSYTSSFYIFTMSSRIYRQELIKLVRSRQVNEDRIRLSVRTDGTGPVLRPRLKTIDIEDVG